jgi:transcriptional regulator with XRE-family HTH domain
MITGDQIRAARKLLGWSRDRLAPRAGVSRTVIWKLEDGGFTTTLTEQVYAIQRVLEAAGVEFTNGDEPGVKLRKAEGGNEPYQESLIRNALQDAGLEFTNGDGPGVKLRKATLS